MALFEDPSFTGDQANSGLLLPPSSEAPPGLGLANDLTPPPAVQVAPQTPGIGITAPAPAASAPVSPAATLIRPSPRDDIQARLASMSPLQKFATVLGEFGAGVTGKPSPLRTQIEDQRKNRLMQVQELRANVGLLQGNIKDLMLLDGDQRNKAIDTMIPQLNRVQPGMGDVLDAYRDSPGRLQWLISNAQEFPEIAASLKMDPTGRAALAISKNPQFMEKVGKRIEDQQLSSLIVPGQAISQHWANLVTPDLAEELKTEYPSGKLSYPAFLRVANNIRENDPAKARTLGLTDQNLALIHRNQDVFSGSVGITSAKDAADIAKKLAEDKGKREVTEVGVGNDQFRKAYVQGGQVVSYVGEPYKKKEGVNITFGAPVAVTDTDPNSPTYGKDILVQPNKKGGAATPIPGVAPVDKSNPIQKVIADTIRGGGNTATPAKAPSAQTGGLPPEIASKLKAGINTRLSDGSVWTLEAGKPKKVK